MTKPTVQKTPGSGHVLQRPVSRTTGQTVLLRDVEAVSALGPQLVFTSVKSLNQRLFNNVWAYVPYTTANRGVSTGTDACIVLRIGQRIFLLFIDAVAWPS